MKKQLFNRVALLVIFIFVINTLANWFFWYHLIWWFDMPMHFLGGLWLSLAGLWYYYFFLPPSPLRPLAVKRIVTVGLLSAIVLGIGWEVLEYIVQALIPGAILADPVDSLSDLFFDTAGGVVGVLYLLSHVSLSESPANKV